MRLLLRRNLAPHACVPWLLPLDGTGARAPWPRVTGTVLSVPAAARRLALAAGRRPSDAAVCIATAVARVLCVQGAQRRGRRAFPGAGRSATSETSFRRCSRRWCPGCWVDACVCVVSDGDAAATHQAVRGRTGWPARSGLLTQRTGGTWCRIEGHEVMASAVAAAARDTIFALSTAPGRAALAIIRASGPATRSGLAALLPRGAAGLPPPRVATRARLTSPGGDALDDSLVLLFPEPHSFTGEDVVELHVHGGPAVVAAVLDACGRLPVRHFCFRCTASPLSHAHFFIPGLAPSCCG